MMTSLVYKFQPLQSLPLKDHTRYLGFTIKQRWTNQKMPATAIPLNHSIDPERNHDCSPCLGSLLPPREHTSMCQLCQWKPLDKILDPLPHGNVHAICRKVESRWHDCREIEDWGGRHDCLSISDPKNMLVWTWYCHKFIIWTNSFQGGIFLLSDPCPKFSYFLDLFSLF